MEKTESPEGAVAAKSISFCCNRGAQEAGGSCCHRTNLEPTFLPPAIKKAEKGGEKKSSLAGDLSLLQISARITSYTSTRSKQPGWDLADQEWHRTTQGGWLCSVSVCVCVCTHQSGCFLPACRLLQGGGTGRLGLPAPPEVH